MSEVTEMGLTAHAGQDTPPKAAPSAWALSAFPGSGASAAFHDPPDTFQPSVDEPAVDFV